MVSKKMWQKLLKGCAKKRIYHWISDLLLLTGMRWIPVREKYIEMLRDRGIRIQ